jgi:2'-5' RNA ligase
LFVALELPLPVRAALVSWGGSAVGDAGGVRLLREDDLHVTLCFLGWQSISSVPSLLAACSAVAGLPAAPLRVLEAMWLPPRRPRVLAVRLEDGSGALADAQRVLSDALFAGGWYVPEKRPFLAHVTVARVSGGPRGGRGRRGGLGDRGASGRRVRELADPPGLSFSGSRITLFRSRLSAAGARYEPLGGVTLG